MKLEEFKQEMNRLFRPDLHLPMHVKRRIYNIYKSQIFNGIEDVIDTELLSSIEKDFKDFCDVHNITFDAKDIIENFHADEANEVQLEGGDLDSKIFTEKIPGDVSCKG